MAIWNTPTIMARIRGTVFFVSIGLLPLDSVADQPVSRSSQQRANTKTLRSHQEEAAQEALYRYLFVSQDWKQLAKVFFVSTSPRGKDPSPSLLRRFKGHIPPVKPASRSRDRSKEEIMRANHPASWVIDKTTRKEGVFFWASNLKWKGDSEIHLRGGYFYNGRTSISATFRLLRIKGKWVVKGTLGLAEVS
jgi:hypothetical protein